MTPAPTSVPRSVSSDDAGPIDAVITWVDGADPAHQARLRAFLEQTGGGDQAAADPTRFGDSGELEYCVSSLLRFAPWLGRIHIVSDRQVPAWLPGLQAAGLGDRVRVVDHRDIFGGLEAYLPTFSNRAIECLLWRVPDLAERFLYLNDDFALLAPTAPEDFFRAQGIVVRGQWRLRRERPWLARAIALLRGMAGAGSVGRVPRPGNHAAQAASARLAGFAARYLQVPHVPHPMRVSTLRRYFDRHPEQLEANVRHRLRHRDQFLTTSLACHLELADGNAIIDNRLKVLRLKLDQESETSLKRQLTRADAQSDVVFACAQSLDQANEAVRGQLLDWLSRRVGRLPPP